MFSVLNTTDYPIILDADANSDMFERMNGFAKSVVSVYSENRFGEKVYVGMVSERADTLTRQGVPRYAYNGYGFPESVETDSAMSINKVVVMSVREWAESSRAPRGLVASI